MLARKPLVFNGPVFGEGYNFMSLKEGRAYRLRLL